MKDTLSIVQVALSSMFSLSVREAGKEPQPTGKGLAVYVPVGLGRCSGVALVCTARLARHAAAAAFDLDVEETTEEDALDCVREIANVIAGQLISERFNESTLGLPQEVTVSALDEIAANQRLIEATDAAFNGERLKVLVFEKVVDDAGTRLGDAA